MFFILPEHDLTEGGTSIEETMLSQALVNETQLVDNDNDQSIHSYATLNSEQLFKLVEFSDEKKCLNI